MCSESVRSQRDIEPWIPQASLGRVGSLGLGAGGPTFHEAQDAGDSFACGSRGRSGQQHAQGSSRDSRRPTSLWPQGTFRDLRARRLTDPAMRSSWYLQESPSCE